MNKVFKIGISVNIALIALSPIPLLADDFFELPTTPLISGDAVDANMMLLLDSSGSMNNIVAEETDDGYDADTEYIDCESEYMMDADNEVYIKIFDDEDVPYFYDAAQGSYIQLGQESETSTSNGRGRNSNTTTTYTKKCFDTDATYVAALYAYTDKGSYQEAVTYYSASYSGNYLNWYFDSSTGAFDGTDDDDDDYSDKQKDGTYIRMEVAKTAAIELVDELTDIRVGLAKYDSSDSYGGADFLVYLDNVEDQLETLQAEINDIEAVGATPLAESLQDLGWYFTNGAVGNLILNEGETNEVSDTAKNIFDYSLNHNSDPADSSDTVIQYWCQNNFIVAMTDGLPTSDAGISENLQDYSTSDDGVNVVQAMYETDLRPSLDESDGTDVVNNVTTYMIGFSDESATSSTLLSNMATAGGGGDLLTAESSEDLLAAFLEASERISAETAAMSSISLNSTSLSSDSVLYQANFSTSSWTGSFSAYEYDEDGELEEIATWDAADELDDFNEDWSSVTPSATRNIFTYDEDSKVGVAFEYENLSADMQSDLQSGPDIDSELSNTNKAKQLINYIYGDNQYEGSSDTDYRARSSMLGDIVNSTSVYVGAPELSWPDYSSDNKFGSSSEPYSEFKSGDAADRDHMVYVGANDGMLHGFYATTSGSDAGEEQLAYIPSMLASSEDEAGLHYLADQNYAHAFYVDASPIVSDVYINNDWRSILVGGLRAGGKGLYALDVTDPDDFDSSDENAENLVLWEFSSDDDSDFGYSYGESAIVMMQNGKWAVITGNGYNSDKGTSNLFILFIEEGADGSWDTGDYIKINTGVGDADLPNGLSTPTVADVDGDSVADYVYAGDLQGNMWVFDVSSKDSDDWVVAYGDSDTPEPLFTAEDSTDTDANAQAITSAPLVVSSDYGLLVFFGTGQYLETDDLSSTDIMTYYGVKDSGGSLLRDDLVMRTLVTDSGLRTIEGDTIDWSASSGWYVDLVNRSSSTGTATEEGERVISASTMSGDIVFFNSVIPDSSACSYGGSSWFMSLDLSTGLAPDYAIFDADGDGAIEQDSTDDSGYIGESYSSAMVSNPTIISNDTTGDSTRISVTSASDIVEDDIYTESDSVSGRMYWEEMVND